MITKTGMPGRTAERGLSGASPIARLLRSDMEVRLHARYDHGLLAMTCLQHSFGPSDSNETL